MRSCTHQRITSFCGQANKCLEGGYPSSLLVGVAESFLKKVRNPEAGMGKKHTQRPVMVPYIHKVAHRLMQMAQRHGIPVVFSAPGKLGRLCARVDRGRTTIPGCVKQHKNKFVPCLDGVVYCIPLMHKTVYIGKTGRCVKDRLLENACSMRSSPSGNLAVHCDRCECTPVLIDTEILAKQRQKTTSEFEEAFFISKYKDKCVSSPSICIYDCELAFISSYRCNGQLIRCYVRDVIGLDV